MTTTKYDDIDKAPQIVVLCQLYLESYGLNIKTLFTNYSTYLLILT